MPAVNDVHSALNLTQVSRVHEPGSVEEVALVVADAARAGGSLSVSGGRHAMGGQQFLSGEALLDLRGLSAVRSLDRERGVLRIGAGAQWPQVVAATEPPAEGAAPVSAGPGPRFGWGIRQKQTGADDLTLGGAIACNAHGRGLSMEPIGADIEDMTVVDASGAVVRCSRDENPNLFKHITGGYGMFGVVAEVALRLSPRRKLVRHVDILDLEDAANAVYRRAAEGAIYGDFQYAIDPSDSSFLRRGVFACYLPASEDAPVRRGESDLARDSWLELLKLAHTDKKKAFALYAQHYLSTHGRVYWSDAMQLSTYIPSYAEFLAAARPEGAARESLMITELFVPPAETLKFMALARVALKEAGVEDIYGTIRAIKKDQTSALPWATSDFACVIFNLRTSHTEDGLARTRRAARSLIDAAAECGGSFYLTYHRWATRKHLLRCYPGLPAWLKAKRRCDPGGVFQSDWYRHVADLVG